VQEHAHTGYAILGKNGGCHQQGIFGGLEFFFRELIVGFAYGGFATHSVLLDLNGPFPVFHLGWKKTQFVDFQNGSEPVD